MHNSALLRGGVGVENPLRGQHILGVSQFDREMLQSIFSKSATMRGLSRNSNGSDALKGKILNLLFYEPSTRTSSSFLAAIQQLGGGFIPITQGVQFSSVSKGETLEDTILTLGQYSDGIILRHPEIGSAQAAAAVSEVPVINAGDGHGEHPTQALLDIFTIKEELGKIDGLRIGMLGDLRFGRTVHSLTELLLMYDVHLTFISPEILTLPHALLEKVIDAGIPFQETEELMGVLPDLDVLYVTRVQQERFTDPSEYESVKDIYVVSPEVMLHAKKKMIVMHPLPRRGEILRTVDSDPRAAYFRQVQNGLYVRMALLQMVMG